jgi:chemotaxis protein MotB
MKSKRRIVVLLAGGVASAGLLAGSGCVSLDQYRKLQMDNSKLIAEKTHLEQELYDARNNTGTLRTKLASTEDQLRTREQYASNLQSENDRLAGAVNRADSLLQDMAKRNVPTTPIIIESALSAALDSAIKDFAMQYPDSIYYDAERGVVKWKSDLLFALGSDVVKQSAMDSLRAFARIMNSPAASGFDVFVVGHTDNTRIGKPQTREKHPTNWHLSAHRAIAVGRALRQQSVPAESIGVMGFGEYRPIASNGSASGRSQNRRVEIYVLPKGTIGGMPQLSSASSSNSMAVQTPANTNRGSTVNRGGTVK